MENIFEGAYFGRFYKMRDGRKAIYLGCRYSFHILSPQDYNGFIAYKENGLVCEGEEQELDIISEWEEPIDEAELHELANEYWADEYNVPKKLFKNADEKLYLELTVKEAYCQGYYAGKGRE